MSDRVIPFDVRARILAKAHNYLCDMDGLIRDGDRAVDLLINALVLSDDDLKLRIVLMLGASGDPRAMPPLYRLMADVRESDSLRHAAAVQLSLLGACTAPDDPSWADKLITLLGHEDPFMRATAAFALGWEGNQRAAAPLVDALRDPDMEVQQAVVSALTNIQDEALFDILIQRLISGSKEQQRCILYHLSCFTGRLREVVGICARFLEHPDADLRYDALVVLDAVSAGAKPLSLYLQSLKDPDPRIREVVLVYLAAEEKENLRCLEADIRTLVEDPLPTIRQAAVRLLHHIQNGPIALPAR